MIERNFVCNRVSAEFLKDNTSQVKLLFGCVGSGKSSTCDVALYMMARQMPPGYDCIRRSRWAVIRSTYSQLKTTTIKTWQEWFPPEVFGDVKGDSPMTHYIKHDDLDMEVIFLALDSLADINRLKSLELTGAYINEAQFVASSDILSTVLERTNRYPGNIYGGALDRPLVIMDCNPPPTSHWIYRIFEVERPEGYKIYKMPSALIKVEGQWKNNPDADFISQVPNKNYWLNLTKGASEEYIKVSLCGEYGVLEDGKAVHPEYNDTFHYAGKKLDANPAVEIGLGWDLYLSPACAVVQLLPNGQFLVLHEFWVQGMDLRQFAENIVLPGLDRLFPFWRKNYVSIHDPADAKGNEGRTSQMILRELGIISMPAQSNSMQFRRDGMKYFLTRSPNGQPGFLLSSACPHIREGLMGKFQYELIRSTALAEVKDYQPKPKKNVWSHICEGLEYIATNYARVAKEPVRDASNLAYEINTGSWMSM